MSAPDDPRTRHERLQRLFLEARALDERERMAFVQEACAEDAELRKELEQLLAHDRPTTGTEDEPDSPLRRELDALRERAAESGEPPPPEFIGEYHVLRKLGEGGMGAVYEARQEKLQRTVALKVLRPGSYSPQTLRRFEHEGEFLGRLEHPGIARIYDSGRAETAFGPQPYFAMELVEGVPLTEYARSRDLSLRERIELISRVADAVEYANRQGVIHRDLKPDNILVGADGQPKILDFGIARASDSDVQLTTQNTDVGQILGTLAYMSPEQATGDPQAIDARSDVYSLGVLLHELVADRLPYDVSRKSMPEALRIIQEEEPPRLSTTNTVLRGDVETIVQTALEKDRTRRYPSAGALAADLRHYLKDEPISARPASRIYTLKKFVRRNKTVVVAAALIFLSLSVGLLASLRFAFDEATRRKELQQLSTLRDVEALIAQAGDPELWPPHPEKLEAYGDWIEEAEVLVARRADFVASRDRLRARALDPLGGEQQRHPSDGEKTRLERLLRRLKTQLYEIRDGKSAALPDRDTIEETDVRVLLAKAADALRPMGRAQGRDEVGLAMALKARELASPEQLADAQSLVAWGHYFLGQNDKAREALEGLRRALDEAPPERCFGLYASPEDPGSLGPGQVAKFNPGPITLSAGKLEAWMKDRDRGDWAASREKKIATVEGQIRDLEADVDMIGALRYADGNDAWWSGQFDELIQGLEELEDDLLSEGAVSLRHGWGVRKRETHAKDLRLGFAPDGEYEQLWAEYLPALQADYPGPGVEPQMGLVPIGQDEASGLWEFAHLASGTIPERGEDGRLVLTDETGIVLVLLRGGEFLMGAQSLDSGVMNYVNIPAKLATETTPSTRAARAIDRYESPPRRVRISPYFLSKYEMTQGQWQQLTGTNPSRDQNAELLKRHSAEGIGDPARHPVNMVSWDACVQTCERFGLRLPTSAEWEYAARGGTQTAWWTGDDPHELRLAANLADEFGLEIGSMAGVPVVESWSDGEAIHARVDRFDPNPFGLYNVHGNLSEWCQDVDWSNGLRLTAYLIDPVAIPTSKNNTFMKEFRVQRGGSFVDIAQFARSAKLKMSTRGAYEDFIGVRPARALD